MKEVDYDIQQEPIVMSKGLIDLLLKEEKASDLIGLYTFYYYTAKWQHTNQPRATTAYTAKGLHWTEERVQARKKILLALNLIEDVQTKNEKGQVTGHYIRIRFIWGKASTEPIKSHPPENPGDGTNGNDTKTTPSNFQTLASQGGNSLSSYSRNALSYNNNTLGSGAAAIKCMESSSQPEKLFPPIPRKRTRPVPEVPSTEAPSQDKSPSQITRDIGRDILKHQGEGLWNLLKKTRGVERLPSGSGYWFQQCTIVGQMVTDLHLDKDRILNLVNWLYSHHSDEYVPRFFDAFDFRQKFFKLEDAMKKSGNGRNLPGEGAKHHAPRNGNVDYTKNTIHIKL